MKMRQNCREKIIIAGIMLATVLSNAMVVCAAPVNMSDGTIIPVGRQRVDPSGQIMEYGGDLGF